MSGVGSGFGPCSWERGRGGETFWAVWAMNPCRAVPGLGIGVWGVPWPGWLEAGLWGSLWADLSLLFSLGGVSHPRKWSAAIKIVFVPLFELFCPFFVIFSSGSALAAWSHVSPDADFVAS